MSRNKHYFTISNKSAKGRTKSLDNSHNVLLCNGENVVVLKVQLLNGIYYYYKNNNNKNYTMLKYMFS